MAEKEAAHEAAMAAAREQIHQHAQKTLEIARQRGEAQAREAIEDECGTNGSKIRQCVKGHQAKSTGHHNARKSARIAKNRAQQQQ